VAVHNGRLPSSAATVLQPVMLVWSIAAVLALFLVGARYSERRRPGSGLDRALSTASDRSFGVFLVHPAVLWLLLDARDRWLPSLHGAPLTVSAYVLVVAGSLAATEVFRRSPLSRPLTGRPRLARPIRSTSSARSTGSTAGSRPAARNATVRPEPVRRLITQSAIDGSAPDVRPGDDPKDRIAAHGEEYRDAHHDTDAPVPGGQAQKYRNDDGDRHRAADALLH
jgi:hypothetical protein